MVMNAMMRSALLPSPFLTMTIENPIKPIIRIAMFTGLRNARLQPVRMSTNKDHTAQAAISIPSFCVLIRLPFPILEKNKLGAGEMQMCGGKRTENTPIPSPAFREARRENHSRKLTRNADVSAEKVSVFGVIRTLFQHSSRRAQIRA